MESNVASIPPKVLNVFCFKDELSRFLNYFTNNLYNRIGLQTAIVFTLFSKSLFAHFDIGFASNLSNYYVIIIKGKLRVLTHLITSLDSRLFKGRLM